MFAQITAFLASIAAFFSCLFSTVDVTNKYAFNIDAAATTAEIGNMAKYVNVWEMGTQFIDPVRNEDNDIFEFTEYVQLMQCSGGNSTRDMFVDPLNREVLDDYDFTRLTENCKGILSLGAKPHLKFGNVPLKYTAEPEIGGFDVNVNPPDDYEVYYNYIKAAADALCDEFGKDEVITWRFGVMTEYENSDWFKTKDGNPEKTATEFCKLYDYTVAALQDAIGENIYVGAHSMTVTEGLWDEDIFIRHCANGTNYKTGLKGSRLCYLSASFYDSKPGKFTSGKTLPETIKYLRTSAEHYGFTDLDYGIDEGRILSGNNSGSDASDLLSRSTGYTWQGAYDARLYGQMMDNGIDYFSYWGYLSGGLMKGIPTVSYHVSKLISDYNGSNALKVTETKHGLDRKAEVSTHAAYCDETKTLRLFVYNFKNNLRYKHSADVTMNINVPRFSDGEATVTVYKINNNCNFFDEWTADKKANGITDNMFSWSPDDGNVSMANATAKALFDANIEKYTACSKLTPETYAAEISNGKLTLKADIPANTVTFFEITENS